MGNINSAHFDETVDDLWWSTNEPNCENRIAKSSTSEYTASNKSVANESSSRVLSEEKEEILSEFKLELARKHEKRKGIILEKKKEMDDLRQEILRLKKENEDLRKLKVTDEQIETDIGKSETIERLRAEIEDLKNRLEEKSRLLQDSECIIEKNRELKKNIAALQADLQSLNTKFVCFETERQEYKNHVAALKDVISVSKHMLHIKETELTELKQKFEEIEKSVAEKELDVFSQDMRNEYERQMANIRNLRILYEERQRVERREKQELISQLDDIKKELQAEKEKGSELKERISELEHDNSQKYDEIKTLESNLGLSRAECKQLQAELAVINRLFSEILLGFNSSQDLDLDKLQKHLEDHRDLLQDIVVNEISSEVSYALPKVLLDLLKQVNNPEEIEEQLKDEPNLLSGQLESIQEEIESTTSTIHQQMNSAEEIVENLPKVWRVLIELLSHQIVPTNTLTNSEDKENPCYKTVETPKGPSLVLSVSQTFIRLKDLILEKKALEKETNHLKQLNGHLENRLQDQEKRLELVHSELSKTWLVVGKMQKQHQMLHTQEKILRYELAQKRKLLTELKEELEYSREKWAEARAKNSKTELQWRQLRTEFAARKNTVLNDDLNNSTESGYSDDRECSSSDDEPGYETDISECAQKTTGGNGVENEEMLPNNETTLSETVGNDLAEEFITEASSEAAASGYIIQKQQLTDVQNSSEDTGQVLSTDTSGRADDGKLTSLEDIETCQNEVAKNPPPEETIHLPSTSNEDFSSFEGPLDNTPSTSKTQIPMRTLEEVLARRDERLRRLEGQAEQLVTKVTNTANRSVVISNRLDDLHGVYGQGSEPEIETNSTSQSDLLEIRDTSVISNIDTNDTDISDENVTDNNNDDEHNT
nr:myosin heavy chain, striated muscle [Leptinotarsa decemlineata]